MRERYGRWGVVIAIWAAIGTLFQLYTAWIGFLPPREQRSLHLFFFLSLAFLLYPARVSRIGKGPSALDIGFVVVALAVCFNSFWNAFDFNMRLEGVTPVENKELIFGGLMIVTALEAIRRAVTPVLTGLILLSLLYLATAEYWPGMLSYRNMSYSEIIDVMYLGNDQGMFGTLTGISTTMVAIFIAFGAAVEQLGLGRLFNSFGCRVAGHQVGGPGKIAVVTSAFFGSISGSATANVFSTGSFTIPMMKRIGYRPNFAGGVETAASVGGQLMPPIMGAGAFVMAELTNIAYIEIVKAAALGAICYFFMLLATVHLTAKREGIRGLSKEEIPSWQMVLRDVHLVLPIVVLIVMLTMRYSPHMSALGSLMATVVVAAFRKHTFPHPKTVWNILVAAGVNTVIVALACLGAGMIVAALTVTGLVISLGGLITSIADGSLVLAGILIMFTTLLMGMGLPTTAAYVITASISTPILISEFGVSTLAANLFVFYFAILADATPPVSIASYAAASISKGSPIATGVQAIRMALAGFIVAFSFLFSPGLLLVGGIGEAVIQAVIVVGSLILIAAGFTGYLFQPLNRYSRAFAVLCGVGVGLGHVLSDAHRLLVMLLAIAVLYAHTRVRKAVED